MWISPHPNGHIQAVGTDAAGRGSISTTRVAGRPQRRRSSTGCWRCRAALPDMRREIAAGSARPWTHPRPRDRLGVATSRPRLLPVRRRAVRRGEQLLRHSDTALRTRDAAEAGVEFDYPAKSDVRRTLLIEDPRWSGRCGRCCAGRNAPIDYSCAATVPAGPTFTPTTSTHDSRSSSATSTRSRICAPGTAPCLRRAAFVDADPAVNKTVTKRVESAVMKEVAEELGNTPAVARGSYVDPRVVEGYEAGLTIAAGARRAARTRVLRQAAGDTGPQPLRG